jgi:hypothetical protein
MNKQTLNIFIILFFIGGCNSKKINYSIYENKDKIFIKVIENNVMSPVDYIYIIDNNNIIVKKGLYIGIGRIKNENKIFKRKIGQNELNEIIDVVKERIIYQLDSVYIKHVIDGFEWYLEIEYNNYKTKILIENKKVKNVETLFNKINQLLPNKIPKISVGMMHD